MPSHYWYRCTQCEYRAFRYRNVKRCPDCGGLLVREEKAQDADQLAAAQELTPDAAGQYA
jgi:rRNA maturation endonuclease Nob1